MGGIGAIPNTAIAAMADEHRLSGYDRFLFKYVIRHLDNHYLAKESEKLSKQRTASK